MKGSYKDGGDRLFYVARRDKTRTKGKIFFLAIRKLFLAISYF